MNKYLDLKSKHQERFNSFPIAFAFSDEQLEVAMVKLGAKSYNELIKIRGGGIIHKKHISDFNNMMRDLNKENKEALKDDEYLFQGFIFELTNHEFCITYDPEDTFNCFNLTKEDVGNDERLNRIYHKAKKEYLLSIKNV